MGRIDGSRVTCVGPGAELKGQCRASGSGTDECCRCITVCAASHIITLEAVNWRSGLATVLGHPKTSSITLRDLVNVELREKGMRSRQGSCRDPQGEHHGGLHVHGDIFVQIRLAWNSVLRARYDDKK